MQRGREGSWNRSAKKMSAVPIVYKEIEKHGFGTRLRDW
jgi:hypothetical protein